jgi:16S rRNA (uracil1498-N3)-methyltransferase
MTRRRWIADEVRGNRAFLTGARADHLIRVLRVRLGQQFDISTGTKVLRGTVAAIHNHEVEFDLTHELPSSGSDLKITLALSIFKFDRMEWAIEKCTELGVSRIIPVISRRTDTHLAAASSKRVERWARITRQASEQSRRATPPEIAAPLKLKEAVALPGSLCLVLAESENQLLLSESLHQQLQTTDLVMAIGPEGGWTADELQLFKQCNWTAVSLGQNILRAETAAIAATAIAISCLA